MSDTQGKDISKSAKKPESGNFIITEEFIKKLEWRALEMFCFYTFRGMGKWDVEHAQGGADGGIDLTFYKRDTKIPLAAVQCKAFSKKYINVSMMRELLGSMAANSIKNGIYITTSYYTQEAADFGRKNNIKTFTASDMAKICNAKLDDARRRYILKILDKPIMQVPTCITCGVKMVVRKAKTGKNAGGKFWGCPNFPKCRNIMHYKE